MKKIIYLLSIVTTVFANTLFANNLTISSIVVTQPALGTGTVSFNVLWDNSWNVTAAPTNWDAVWLIVKFKDCAAATTAPYTHGEIDGAVANRTIPAVFDVMTTASAACGALTIASSIQTGALDCSGATGIMIRRSATGSGTVSGTIILRITNMPAAATVITTSVFGIEMVYVPEGNFLIGDGDGVAATNSIVRFLNTATAAALPMSITSAFETAASTLITNFGPTTISSVPLAWPKGWYGFYMMKHEISQGLYAEFLNTLGAASTPQTNRAPGSVGGNRQQTQWVVATQTYMSNRPDRAQNFISWNDYSAFLDWACLRPFTELEYEKAARGPLPHIINEYPWGMGAATAGAIAAAVTFTAPGLETGLETVIGGNAVYSNNSWTNGDGGQGPARAGIFATSVSTRAMAGAGYYGVLELGGNLREYAIGIHSTAASNVFTRFWGNGTLNATNGEHDVAGGWPLAGHLVSSCNATNNLVVNRGGCWQDAPDRLQTSDRQHAQCPAILRANLNGGRGVR